MGSGALVDRTGMDEYLSCVLNVHLWNMQGPPELVRAIGLVPPADLSDDLLCTSSEARAMRRGKTRTSPTMGQPALARFASASGPPASGGFLMPFTKR